MSSFHPYSYYLQQESLIKIVDACSDKTSNMDRWLSKLESSNWMGHIKDALGVACLVAQCIDRYDGNIYLHES